MESSLGGGAHTRVHGRRYNIVGEGMEATPVGGPLHRGSDTPTPSTMNVAPATVAVLQQHHHHHQQQQQLQRQQHQQQHQQQQQQTHIPFQRAPHTTNPRGSRNGRQKRGGGGIWRQTLTDGGDEGALDSRPSSATSEGHPQNARHAGSSGGAQQKGESMCVCPNVCGPSHARKEACMPILRNSRTRTNTLFAQTHTARR